MHRVSAFVSVCLVFLLSGVAAAQSAPQWIWSSKSPKDGQSVYLHRTFVAKPGLVQAVLMGVCDDTMVVHVNGQRVAKVSGFQKPGSADVTGLIRPGENVIAIEATHRTGTAGVCVLLQMASDEGPQPVLMSDTTWRASDKPIADWTKASFRPKTWQRAVSVAKYGGPEVKQFGHPFNNKVAFDAYNSWRLAAGANQATPASDIRVPEGYKVELIRSAQQGEDSWIGLAFDPKGRLTIAKEKRGLLRLTLDGNRVSKLETIEDSLLECRGMLYAYGSLYVNANNSKGFYRLRDTNNDGKFDERKLLLATEGGVGHGRNHVVLGPDGGIFLVHGNAVKVPANVAPTSPYKNYAEDQLIPNPWDKAWSGGDIIAPGGHIIRTDKDGSKFELYAGGFRNQLDLAFNEAGELFTYDADLEWDVGLPWYRPTRVNHVIPGGEYGWRRGTGKSPAYYPDTLPAVADTGMGSPTGIEFGTKSKFPSRYRKALFICDWAYGRIHAVHMKEQGATYTGSFETFAQGRPMNVTDLKFGPDGAMYFTTGGRQTQSGLYRISFVGPATDEPKIKLDADAAFEAEASRMLRSISESRQRKVENGTVRIIDDLFAQMATGGRFQRFAARVALEHQDVSGWFRRALTEKNVRAGLHGLLALVRVGDATQKVAAISNLSQFNLRDMKEEDLLVALRTFAVGFSRLGRIDATTAVSIRQKLDPLYPHESWRVNHELCEMLVILGSAKVRNTTFELLAKTKEPADLAHYLITIRYQQKGWTLEQLSLYFQNLNRASLAHRGSYYQRSIKSLRAELTKKLPENVKERLGLVIMEPAVPANIVPLTTDKPTFVRDWKMDELASELGQASKGRSFESGRRAFVTARCVQCHQFGNLSPRAAVGPDLTAVASRFSRKDLLVSIIEPSKAIGDKYRQTKLTLRDGSVAAGMLVGGDNHQLVLQANLLSDETVTIKKSEIEKNEFAATSSMPTGLISVLTKKQILDLLAFLESSGNRHHTAFKR